MGTASDRVRRSERGERGAAAVEFGLVLPILLMLVFGIIQYSLYFWAMQGGSDIARDAARSAAVVNPARCADFTRDVKQQVEGLVGGGRVVRVQRVYVLDPGQSRATPSYVLPNDTVKVTVQFKSYDLHLPFVPFIDEGLVDASAEARVEYVPQQPEVSCAPATP